MNLKEYLKENYPDINFEDIVFFDTETTGLEVSKGHRIVEFGAVTSSEYDEQTSHHYFNPDRAIDKEAIETHGLTIERLEEEPEFYLRAVEIASFMYGRFVMAHNARFDVEFIDEEFKIASRRLDKDIGTLSSNCVVIDTMSLAKLIFPGQRHSLDALCNKLGVDKSSRKYHGALLDAMLLKEVFNKMLSCEISNAYDNDQKPFYDEVPKLKIELKSRPRVVDFDI